jgi:hypothetical protein
MIKGMVIKMVLGWQVTYSVRVKRDVNKQHKIYWINKKKKALSRKVIHFHHSSKKLVI